MDYLKISFQIEPREPWTEILIDALADAGFESFTEDHEQLQAYIPQRDFQQSDLDHLIAEYKQRDVSIAYSEEVIPAQNWNAVWESDFDPVQVNNRLFIRAPFHSPNNQCDLEIVIQPKMSFGTGHHQTTFLLAQVMLAMNFEHKKVLDVGTGTGVLGILAAKMGASSIIGTDIEPGAIENAKENIERNAVENFTVLEGDIDILPPDDYDIIIANINKNVLQSHFGTYADLIKKGGRLLLSGFFEADVAEMSDSAREYGFTTKEIYNYETWAVLLCEKN
mgnify:CR=1 FL=1